MGRTSRYWPRMRMGLYGNGGGGLFNGVKWGPAASFDPSQMPMVTGDGSAENGPVMGHASAYSPRSTSVARRTGPTARCSTHRISIARYAEPSVHGRVGPFSTWSGLLGCR